MTRRQQHILQLTAADKPRKEIAWLLKLSVKTIDFHIARIRHALNVQTDAGMVAEAIWKHILQGP